MKIKYVLEQMLNVTLFPIMFTVLFTTIYMGLTLNTDISKGVFDRFRSLPIWQPSVWWIVESINL